MPFRTTLQQVFNKGHALDKKFYFSNELLSKIAYSVVATRENGFLLNSSLKKASTPERLEYFSGNYEVSSLSILKAARWTKQEIVLLDRLKGLSFKDFHKTAKELFPHRTLCSVKSKLVKLKKKNELSLSTSEPKVFVKQTWSQQEDVKLLELVAAYGLDIIKLQESFPEKKPTSIKYRISSLKHNSKKGKWLPEEVHLFEKGVEKHGQDWALVSQHVGTRNPSQCLKRFYYSFGNGWKPNSKTKFTHEQTERIFQLVEEFGTNDWSTVAYFYGTTHTRAQIQNHYRSQLRVKEASDVWSPEEDSALIKAVEEAKDMAWIDISKRSGAKHNWLSCYNRWLEINPRLKTGDWSSEEVLQLNFLASKYSSWSAVSFHLKTRTFSECKNMWYKWNFPKPKATSWSSSEVALLETITSKLGNDRHKIACLMGTRTCEAIKTKIYRDS